ncbi:MAG: hypothetical protein CMJ81_18335 [Planctomycetaceae bacterium]|nr:hypothetical protein [Planctomycetaceae bacterium]
MALLTGRTGSAWERIHQAFHNSSLLQNVPKVSILATRTDRFHTGTSDFSGFSVRKSGQYNRH